MPDKTEYTAEHLEERAVGTAQSGGSINKTKYACIYIYLMMLRSYQLQLSMHACMCACIYNVYVSKRVDGVVIKQIYQFTKLLYKFTFVVRGSCCAI